MGVIKKYMTENDNKSNDIKYHAENNWMSDLSFSIPITYVHISALFNNFGIF
jgi:hypothetical protein